MDQPGSLPGYPTIVMDDRGRWSVSAGCNPVAFYGLSKFESYIILHFWGLGRVPGFVLQTDSLIGSSPISSTKFVSIEGPRGDWVNGKPFI